MLDLVRHSPLRDFALLPTHFLKYRYKNTTKPQSPVERRKNLESAAKEFAASAAKSPVLLANQFGIESRQQWNDMLAEARKPLKEHGLDSKRVKAVLWYRDPFEMIISAANYHLKAKEKWLDETAHVQVYKIFYACGRDAAWLEAHGVVGKNATALRAHGHLEWMLHSWKSGADSDVCEAVESIRGGRNVTDLTYRQLLVGVPLGVAVRIEAVSAVDNAIMMKDAYLSLVDDPNSLVVDLGSAMRDFNATFTRMFTFLGVRDIDHCVNTASKHDINSRHSRAGVYTTNVHVSSLTEDVKDIERRALATSPWVRQHVQPIRKSMGWASS